MAVHPFLLELKDKVAVRRQAGLGRDLLPVSTRDGRTVTIAGRRLLDFSSNDFLGLGRSRALAATMRDLCLTGGGAGASRLVTGTSTSTLQAEAALARHFGYESCLIVGSGFLANLTLMATLFSSEHVLALDKRAHTSLMAGVLHSRARFHTFRHNNLSHLEKILHAHAVTAVITESLFSMDADSPDFSALQKLKHGLGFLSIVDEAHAFGVLGPQGRGLAHTVADVAVGTLGKAFGLFGAFVLGPQAVRDYLIHFGQGFIYTTALPPWHGDMVLAMLDRIIQADDRRHQLASLSKTARDLLTEAGWQVRGRHHILALHIGDEPASLAMSAALRQKGVLAFAARYPTVPLGRAMLRICLSSGHSVADLEALRDALTLARKNCFVPRSPEASDPPMSMGNCDAPISNEQ